MPQDQTTEVISSIIDYPTDKDGKIVTRRPGLSRMKPRLDAPPANQPGSVDWTMTTLFGSTSAALEMIESLVAGQGENAEEKWVQVVLLYRKWEQDHQRGELDSPPNLNQVCHSLNFETRDFIRDLQNGVQMMMTSMSKLRASLVSPLVVSNLNRRAMSADADTKDIELQLKVAGVLDDGKGQVNVQINNQQNVLLKGEREKMKTPLLQFRDTTDNIDEEVRNENVG